MAGLQVAGYLGGEELVRDQYLPTVYSEWEGPPEYSASHFVRLPISQQGRDSGASSVAARHLSPELCEYSLAAVDLDALFSLQTG